MQSRVSTLNQFYIFGAVLIFSLISGFISKQYALFAIPLLYLGAFITIVDFKYIYYALLASLPISTALEIGGGFSLDFPSEPLMLVLTGVFVLMIARSPYTLSERFWKHPITLLLILHLVWICIATLNSANLIVSIKFTLAKIWFVVPFYFLSAYFLREKKDIKRIFWIVFVSLMFTVLIVFLRHAALGFSFEHQKSVMGPFYSNHVSYANIMALFFPWICLAVFWYKRKSRYAKLLLLTAAFLLIAIYFSYTRAAYISLLVAAAVYVLVRLRLMRYIVVLAFAGLIGLVSFLVHDNKYLEYAPNYETTIAHKDFSKLMDATTKGEDLSTMERLYRWVAAFRMVETKPIFGFGPGNFYFFYKPYTLNRFKTYVSRNPEKSGTHNYFLMTATDQGVPGLLIFLFLTFVVFVKGEQTFHRLKDPVLKSMAMAAMLCLVVIYTFLLINDMLELDKVGGFYFMCLALLVNLDRREFFNSVQNRDSSNEI